LAEKFVISIVDDDESVREALVSLMQSHGYDAKAFASAAHYLAEPGHTDCLITDMRMSGMTGLELASRVIAEHPNVPVILVTALPDENLRWRALKAGVICYLPKPLDEKRLLICIHSALNERNTERR
jgi:FixJ family two-component response regulator